MYHIGFEQGFVYFVIVLLFATAKNVLFILCCKLLQLILFCCLRNSIDMLAIFLFIFEVF